MRTSYSSSFNEFNSIVNSHYSTKNLNFFGMFETNYRARLDTDFVISFTEAFITRPKFMYVHWGIEESSPKNEILDIINNIQYKYDYTNKKKLKSRRKIWFRETLTPEHLLAAVIPKHRAKQTSSDA